jgi:hypothetical protein
LPPYSAQPPSRHGSWKGERTTNPLPSLRSKEDCNDSALISSHGCGELNVSDSSKAMNLQGTKQEPEAAAVRPDSALKMVLQHLRKGRFQRSLALITAGSSVASTLEVAYEHYKGSYSNPVMYSPVILSAALSGAAGWVVVQAGPAVTALRAISYTTLADGLVGFGFHVRGIRRKPGGWRLPLINIIMGPPIFAPLLFGTAAYLGVMASYLKREGAAESGTPVSYTGWRSDIYEGKFQRHLASVTALWTIFSGFEAWYSHYKSNFRYKAQWLPVIMSPILLFASLGAVAHRHIATTLLPAASVLTIANGGVGFVMHARGVMRRPGGKGARLHKILYGPPIFAPLLFAACGMLGLMASLLRREGDR